MQFGETSQETLTIRPLASVSHGLSASSNDW
jgi:hypothetical protein